MLRVLDRSFDSPEANLAFDDSFLESGCETLRFWESPDFCVVLGRSSRADKDVDLPACEAAGIPMLRRSSGGGTVLLGPGCLNYALALSLEMRPELTSVRESYRFILDRVSGGLQVGGVQVRESDLLLHGRKFSGNAQRRTRGWLLHHGTILYGFETGLMERLLRIPTRQPAHRGGRPHSAFVTNVPLPADELKRRIEAAWAGPVQAASCSGGDGQTLFSETNPATSISCGL